MLGFGVPLAVLLAVESVAALLLLGPVSVAYPVILLARTSKTSVGTTVVGAYVFCTAASRGIYLFMERWNYQICWRHYAVADACVCRHDLRVPQLSPAVAAL